jgi:hypothetical protein
MKNIEEEGKNSNIVTRGGAKTREDATKKDHYQYRLARKNTMHEHKFYAHKEKETFKEATQAILKENIASTSRMKPVYHIPVYEMSPLFDQTSREQPSEQVGNMIKKFGSCVKLLNDKSSLQVLQNLL